MNYDDLDPGIREVVRLVNEAGFVTTDSGDGVSKPAEWYQPDERGVTEAFPFQHVVAESCRETLIDDADRLAAVLGIGWAVEATYGTADGICYLFARPADVEQG